MDFDRAFATIFLGVFALTFLVHQVVRAGRHLRRPLIRTFERYILLPRIFKGRHRINPTRAQIACFVVHYSVAGFYNAWQVHTISDAAKRAGRSALIHMLPLLTPNHVYFLSHLFGSSLPLAEQAHYMLGCMSILQGSIHCVLQAYERHWKPSMGIVEISVRYEQSTQMVRADLIIRQS